jgi:hypothetical protein
MTLRDIVLTIASYKFLKPFMPHKGQQRRSALITVADKCLLYSESDRIAAWTRNDAKCH